MKALVYVTALAPDEGEKVADVFYRVAPHPKAPKLAPDNHGLIWLPDDAFKNAFAPNARAEDLAVLSAVQRPISPACITVPVERPLWKDRAELVPGRGRGPHDPAGDAALHGGADEGEGEGACGRSHAASSPRPLSSSTSSVKRSAASPLRPRPSTQNHQLTRTRRTPMTAVQYKPPTSTASRCSIGKRAARARRSCCCCTAFRAPATCSAI